MSSPSSPSTSPSSFFKSELERALSEQTFGIAGYSMRSSSTYEAGATVELLEHVQIEVTLTIRGYRATSGSSLITANTNVDFETLEALLQHYSPLYSSKRTELLFAKFST